MQLIPNLVLQHLSNPAHIETLFIKYIEKAGLRIDASKTIAGVAYFHKQEWPLNTRSLSYFNGDFDSDLTNMPGNSFIRPQSEHTLIWAMRVEDANSGDPLTSFYTPGLSSAFLRNCEFTITTNSEVKIKDFPLSEGLSDMTVRTDGLIPFAEPIFWGGQQDFKVDVVNVAAGSPLSTNLKLTLIGMGLI